MQKCVHQPIKEIAAAVQKALNSFLFIEKVRPPPPPFPLPATIMHIIHKTYIS